MDKLVIPDKTFESFPDQRPISFVSNPIIFQENKSEVVLAQQSSSSLFKIDSTKSDVSQTISKDEQKEPAKLGLFSNLFSKNIILPKPEENKVEEEAKPKEDTKEKSKASLFSLDSSNKRSGLFNGSNSLFQNSGLINQNLFLANLNQPKLFVDVLTPEKKEEAKPQEEQKIEEKPKLSLFNNFFTSNTPNTSTSG